MSSCNIYGVQQDTKILLDCIYVYYTQQHILGVNELKEQLYVAHFVSPAVLYIAMQECTQRVSRSG